MFYNIERVEEKELDEEMNNRTFNYFRKNNYNIEPEVKASPKKIKPVVKLCSLFFIV